MTAPEFETKQDELFHHLSYIADVFTEAGVSFQIADGTLLGAVREGDILKTEERDFDLDVADSEVEKIRQLSERVQKDGYEIIERTSDVADFGLGYDIWNMKAERTANGGAGFLINFNGEFVGDVYIYTVFDDGLARRYCVESEAMVNAKMTIPAWLLEESKSVYIRGKEFPGSRSPEKLLAKTYGSDWTTPIAPGEFGPGRNPDSGGIYDSDMEHLIIDAIGNGWQPDYLDRTQWKRRVKKVGSYASRRWLLSHDPLYIIEDKTLFTQQERDILLEQMDASPSEQLQLMMIKVICSRLSQKKRDMAVELKTSKSTSDLANAKIKKIEAELGDAKRQLTTKQSQLAAAQSQFESFKQRKSIKIALKLVNPIIKIRNFLRNK